MIILGSFPDEDALMRAVQALDAQGLGPVETHTPAPPAAGHTALKFIMFIAGVLGAAGGFALQAIATGWAYPIDIGGRPDVFWPAYIPFALETGLLGAMVAGFLGFLFVNRLPALYDPIDESNHFRHATQDAWFVALRSNDAYVQDKAKSVLAKLHPMRLEEVES